MYIFFLNARVGFLGGGAGLALDEAAAPREGERFVVLRLLKAVVEFLSRRVIRLNFWPMWLEFLASPEKRVLRDVRTSRANDPGFETCWLD